MSVGDNGFYYSKTYEDREFLYRHVHINVNLVPLLPKDHLMSESEWRAIGIQQRPGWEHYERFKPEPHVILFRRRKSTPSSPPPLPTAIDIICKKRHPI